MKYAHAMPFGAQLLEDSRTQFRLWAPGAQGVDLELKAGEDCRLLPMQATQGGWFMATAERAPAGTPYMFRIDGRVSVPDPASRWNPDDVHGASVVVDPRAFEWPDAQWRGRPWEEAVIYELHVGSFTAEGTFAAVEAKLDYLVDLGITALELMPVSDFPGKRNWGYDGVLPFAPDAAYGKPDDLKRLIAAAQARGLMVLLDVVYNHFGPEGNYLHVYAAPFSIRRGIRRGARPSTSTPSRPPRCVTSSFTTPFTGSRNITSTVCVWMPFTRFWMLRTRVLLPNSRRRCARGRGRLATCTWCWRMT